MAEVAGELDRETLQRLKRECGGLQTLLRNSPRVFQGEARPCTPAPALGAPSPSRGMTLSALRPQLQHWGAPVPFLRK